MSTSAILIWLTSHLRTHREFYVRVAKAIFAGILIELVIILLHHSPYVVSLENTAFDRILRFYKATRPRHYVPNPFVIIDIDEKTHALWGRPVPLPQDKVVELVDFALRGQPAVVVVDVDISREDADSGAPTRSLVSTLIERSMAESATDAAAKKSSDAAVPPILLMRRLPAGAVSEHARDRTAPKSHLDDLVPLDPRQATAPLYWSASMFGRDPDWSVRRWRMWEEVCLDDEPRLFASVPLLVDTVLQGGRDGVAELYEQLPRQGRAVCEHDHKSVVSVLSARIRVGRRELKYPASEIRQRIIYTLPWRLDEGRHYPIVRGAGRHAPLLTVLSAFDVSKPDAGVSTDLLRNAIVIIGGSFTEGRDLHLTPFGDMPGTLILANAINSFREHGQLGPPPTWLKMVTLCGAIFVVAVLFAMLRPFYARLAVAAASIALMLPLSALVFRAGIWLDFALPLLAVELHGILSQIEELRNKHEELVRVPVEAKVLACVIAAIALVLVFAASPRAEEPPAEVGYVSGFSGGNGVRWIRGVKAQELRLLKPVCAGDRFDFLDTSATVEVLLGNEHQTLSLNDLGKSQFIVPALEPEDGPSLESIMAMILGIDATPVEHEVQAGVSIAGVRELRGDDSFSVHLLEPDHQKVIEGTRKLTLVWHGNKKPFLIFHRDPSGEQLYKAQTQDAKEEWEALLAPGVHEIEIRDAAGRSATGHLDVVPATELPSGVIAFDPDAPVTRNVVDALRLSIWEDPHWKLEALMRLSSLNTVNASLSRVRRDLESGRQPKLTSEGGEEDAPAACKTSPPSRVVVLQHRRLSAPSRRSPTCP